MNFNNTFDFRKYDSEIPIDTIRNTFSNYNTKDKEIMFALLRDKSKNSIETILLGIGEKKSVKVDILDILDIFKKKKFSQLLLTHNHTSGNCTPSVKDIYTTKHLMFLSAAHNVEFLDHIVICENEYFSFKKNGLIKKYQESIFQELA